MKREEDEHHARMARIGAFVLVVVVALIIGLMYGPTWAVVLMLLAALRFISGLGH